jgi:serine/threonine protein kinase
VNGTLAPGATFAGYRVESLVGRGGMGVVYRATDLSLERPVALKLIAPELAESERFRERFHKEPRLAASLDHPNVVPIYEAGERDGRLYLAMRYVEGSDLKTILGREGKLSPERSLAILAQIAGALDAAHRRGLVHRDVKPANVLLDEDGHAYLTDFGITKQLGGASTETGRMVGTLDYLRPSRSAASRWMGAPTATRSPACCTSACPGPRPSEGRPRRRVCGRTCRNSRARCAATSRSTRCSSGRSPREKDQRYVSCTELIEAARAALGLASPPAQLFAPPALVRRRRAIFLTGVLVLAGAVAAGIVAFTTGEAPSRPRLGTASPRSTPRRGVSPRSPSRRPPRATSPSARAPSGS